MAPGLQHIHTHYYPETNDVHTDLKLELNNGVKVKLGYSKAADCVEAELHGDGWEAGYHFGTRDVKFEFERDTSAGKLKVKQLIPGSKWPFFPSPHVQLNMKMLGDGKDRLKLGYNFFTSKADYEATLWTDKFKMKIEGDHDKGNVLTLTAKPKTWGFHKLALTYSLLAGPSVGATIKAFNNQVKAKALTHIQQQQLEAKLEIKHPQWEGSILHLETRMPFSGNGSLLKVGLHYDL